MTDIVKKTVTTQKNDNGVVTVAPVVMGETNSQSISNVIYFLFGILEVLLAFRFLFKLTGASAGSAFVSMIYSLTGVFIMPFEGIFRKVFSEGVMTTSVVEPSTIVAIVVYALLAWGVVKFVSVLSREQNLS